MAAALSAWQEASPPSHQGAIYRRYGLSWIVGGLAGESLGLIIIILGCDDRAVLITSIFIAIAQFPIIKRVSIPGVDRLAGVPGHAIPVLVSSSSEANQQLESSESDR
jgi:hypothetical protein